jgi:hypothetical protein
MLKQIIVTLDTSDPLQAQLLVEYLASSDRVRFGRCCMLLGYLAATKEAEEHQKLAAIEEAAPKITPSIALTLEDLGIDEEELPPSSEAKHPASLAIPSIEPGAPSSSSLPTPSTTPTPHTPKDEMKTAAKPKVGGGLFGLG